MDRRNDWDKSNVLFHNKANEAMLLLFHDFKKAMGPINRRQDENVFQQQLGIYAAKLKRSLDEIALSMLDNAAAEIPRKEWNQALSSFIHSYVSEFKLKAKSL